MVSTISLRFCLTYSLCPFNNNILCPIFEKYDQSQNHENVHYWSRSLQEVLVIQENSIDFYLIYKVMFPLSCLRHMKGLQKDLLAESSCLYQE
jgi:hypothetical protein